MKIFYPIPTYTLSQYVTKQLLIKPVLKNAMDQRTPEIVRLVLTQLEMIKLSKNISTEKILASFYDLNNTEFFESKWDGSYEKRLTFLKNVIDSGEFKVSQETDPRVLCQLLLDFLEGLMDPAISEITINHLSTLTGSGMSSQDILNDQFSSDKHIGTRDQHTVDQFD